MENLNKQVWLASRQLSRGRFVAILGWALLASLIVAVIAIGVPKWKPLPWEAASNPAWAWTWLGGAIGVGILAAAILTWLRKSDPLAAAIEIDHRFHLKERVSSALALTESHQDSEAGRALMKDASRKIERVDIQEAFRIKPRWPLALPLLPLTLGALLTLLPDAVSPPSVEAEKEKKIAERVVDSTQELQRRISERRQAAENSDLREAEEMLRRLEEGLDQLASQENNNQEKALVELNRLSEDLENRKQQLDSGKNLQRQMEQMTDLRRGPVDEIIRSMQRGDFQKASEQLEQLAEQLRSESLSEEESEALENQLAQMQESLQQMAAAHAAAQEDLEQQIAQNRAQGKGEVADQLQKQLDQLQQQNNEMQRMEDLAEALSECSQCLGEGEREGAASQLNQLAEQLHSLEQEMRELEMIEGTLDQISECKNGICQGGSPQEGTTPGSAAAQRIAQSNGQGRGQGTGPGQGQGSGERPLDDSDNPQFIDSQVQAEAEAASSVVVDFVPGPNSAGITREEINTSIEEGRQAEANPLTDLHIPRSQREHVTEYFNRFREGNVATPDSSDP